eukprot:1778534-Pleurochrysis_carterae.AAC.1
MAAILCIALETLSMYALQTSARSGPTTLSNIGKDNLEMLCCFLPVLAIGVFAQVSKEAREAAESESVWRAHLYTFVEEYPKLLPQFTALFAGVEAGQGSYRASFFSARNNLRSWQCMQAAAFWKAKDLSSQKELGAIVNAGAINAAFIPFGKIETPVKMKAALELLHFVPSTPQDLSSGARAKTDFYRQTGELLGRESLRTALQRAEQHRQHEDTDARGARVLACLRKERDAAVVQEEKKQKICISLRKKLEVSEENAAASVQRVQATRAGAATLDAERRAVAAESQEAELLKAAYLRDAELKSVERRAAAWQAALDAATGDVKHAHRLVGALRQSLASEFAEINASK